MRVFMTGASGYVGGVVAEHLVAAGHEVLALARSQAAADACERAGAEVVHGGLADTGVLRASAARAAAVVHAAVDYTDPQMREVEAPALAALLAGLPSGRPFVYTSSGFVYPDSAGVALTEEQPVEQATSPQPYKVLGERQVLAVQRLRGVVLRGALVYGRGGSGLLQAMLGGAAATGSAIYIGTGENRWSTVHVDDLAELCVTALSEPAATGVYNVASPVRVSMRELAGAVAQITGAQAVSVSLEQAEQVYGPMAAVLTRSTPLDASRAHRELGWTPSSPSLLDELVKGSYALAAQS